MITIGQSPREDIMKDLLQILPRNIEILQVGALDDFKTKDEIMRSLKPESGDVVYVSRLRDGEEVKISKNKLIPLMSSKIKYLDSQKVDLLIILCSGEFPKFEVSTPIVYPEKILKGIASSISYSGRVAITIPSSEQIEYAYNKWSEYFSKLEVIPISPYSSNVEDYKIVGEKIKEKDIKLVIMDCMGYSFEHKNAIRVSAPFAKIITTRGVTVRSILEMF
ncbi:MAG: AroM family protein [Nitrososphaeria archaeon]|nr:AroM family protein [Nitrososphaeria archaeon]